MVQKMPIQRDLDLAMEQMEELSPMTLALYAYAAFKLLQKKRPQAVKEGAVGLFIADAPCYSKLYQREIPGFVSVKITVEEIIPGDA